MKTTIKTKRCEYFNQVSHILAVGVLVAFFFIASNQGYGAAKSTIKVVTYPTPTGEVLSTDYEVHAAGQKVDVYMARVLDPPFAGREWDHGGSYSFANFDMSGSVIVRIMSKQSLKNVVIRPQSYKIQPTLLDDHTLELKLDRPYKLSIEPNDRKAPLLLFANPLEINVPKLNDEGVIFYGPGVHKPEKIVLNSNQTLYLAGSAVVKAEVLAQ